jgi:cytochrome c peroxidase
MLPHFRFDDERVTRWVGCVAASVALMACAAPADDPNAPARLGSVDQALSRGAEPQEAAPTLSDAEWGVLGTLSPLPAPPPDTTNAYADSRRAAELGQRLFFDAGFSGPLRVASDLGAVGDVGKVSCASCHSGKYLDDERSVPRNVSLGTDFHTRNAPAIVNSAFYAWTNWGGRFSAQWELPIAVVESPIIMNGNRLQLAHRLFAVYRRPYEKLFGALEPALGSDPLRFPAAGKPKAAATDPDGAWELMAAADRTIVNRILVNYAKALAAYFRVLVSRNAPFDDFVAGDECAISADAQRGALLFIGKARCVGCHGGPDFADDRFHNLGVPQQGEHVPATDSGRFGNVAALLGSAFNSAGAFSDDPSEGARRLAGLAVPMPDETQGAFRTAGLRGVAQTEPYMHSGQLATLADVLEFYDQGGGTPAIGTRNPRLQPLGLSAGEKADLIEFLKSLSGERPPRRLVRDTSLD